MSFQVTLSGYVLCTDLSCDEEQRVRERNQFFENVPHTFADVCLCTLQPNDELIRNFTVSFVHLLPFLFLPDAIFRNGKAYLPPCYRSAYLGWSLYMGRYPKISHFSERALCINMGVSSTRSAYRRKLQRLNSSNLAKGLCGHQEVFQCSFERFKALLSAHCRWNSEDSEESFRNFPLDTHRVMAQVLLSLIKFDMGGTTPVCSPGHPFIMSRITYLAAIPSSSMDLWEATVVYHCLPLENYMEGSEIQKILGGFGEEC